MGNCSSCLKTQTDSDIVTSDKNKNEMVEIVTTTQVPAVMVSDYPQEQPLLFNVENNIERDQSSHQTTNTMHSNPPIKEITILQKSNIPNDRSLKPFYQKLPSIPRNISLLGFSESCVSEAKINQLFDQYKDFSEDVILAEGIENLCNDLELSPDEFKVLVLAWKLNASQMCRFTKSEFVLGLKDMKADSIKGIQLKLNDIANDLKTDYENFKDLYRFTFRFGLDVNSGQRILSTDAAVLLWRIVFTHNEPPILKRWLNYLENNNHIRGIPKDTWQMFLNFSECIGNDLSSYDDTEAWPSLFDDFVEYENDQMNQNNIKDTLKLED